MDWDAIGAVGEILGAAAVFISLAYLAFQLKHASVATRHASQNAFIADYNRILELIFTDSEVADFLLKTNHTGFTNLGPREQERMHAFLSMQNLSTLNLYIQVSEGQFDRRMGDPMITFWAMVCKSNVAGDWWETNKMAWNKEYVQFIDSLIADPATPKIEDSQPWYARPIG